MWWPSLVILQHNTKSFTGGKGRRCWQSIMGDSRPGWLRFCTDIGSRGMQWYMVTKLGMMSSLKLDFVLLSLHDSEIIGIGIVYWWAGDLIRHLSMKQGFTSFTVRIHLLSVLCSELFCFFLSNTNTLVCVWWPHLCPPQSLWANYCHVHCKGYF